MNFSDGLNNLKKGKKIERKASNGVSIVLFFGFHRQPAYIETSEGIPWIPKQEDILATDWYIVR